jgi:hypothetical protein
MRSQGNLGTRDSGVDNFVHITGIMMFILEDFVGLV